MEQKVLHDRKKADREQRRRDRDERYTQRKSEWLLNQAERLRVKAMNEERRVMVVDAMRREVYGTTTNNNINTNTTFNNSGSISKDNNNPYNTNTTLLDHLNEEQEVALLHHLNPADDTESEVSRSDDTITSPEGVKAVVARSISFLPLSLRIDKESKILRRERSRTLKKKRLHADR